MVEEKNKENVTMDLTPLISASPFVKIHIAFAILAILLGAMQFIWKKGTYSHKSIGWIWVVIMCFVGISAISLPFRHNGFPITILLSVWVLIGLPLAVYAIKKGNIMRHRAYMIGLYAGGLFIAATFALTPGRVLYKVFFGH